MNAVAGTVRQLTRAANRAVTMTTEAAGAIGGAAVNGVIGGVKGAASGAQHGLSSGSHSTPAAALTLGALGVAGLVEWPILVAVGGTALVIKQLNNRSNGKDATAATSAKKPTTAARPLKAVKSTASGSATRRSPQAKKTTTRQPRSGTNSGGSRARARH
ncbi:hypothetical protein [[Mycobacterium] crassicus]|uniref:Transmembrane protein n=1 Tax=[Mycobacterium] crassicus TaxID=2872309 RepID=A0ABU5XDW7_9MYCO|nr:hypothetical protein [Mycolicibacter sp. MYC098]MEB3020505.1 hypothetical protein [Mycolicibacter sp. MYC098]